MTLKDIAEMAGVSTMTVSKRNQRKDKPCFTENKG